MGWGGGEEQYGHTRLPPVATALSFRMVQLARMLLYLLVELDPESVGGCLRLPLLLGHFLLHLGETVPVPMHQLHTHLVSSLWGQDVLLAVSQWCMFGGPPFGLLIHLSHRHPGTTVASICRRGREGACKLGSSNMLRVQEASVGRRGEGVAWV